jgi:threonine dehydrogenase-like Zn-dependent dehydrogenase
MKALVYLAPAKKALEERPRPKIAAPSDAIVKITKTTICGTDLHILKGDVPGCAPGRILGHEGVGVIDEVGPAVTAFKAGDRVLISCISACGKCVYCRKLMYSHCTTGGRILGNKIDGTQAEFVRIPYADTSLHHIPDGADEEAPVALHLERLWDRNITISTRLVDTVSTPMLLDILQSRKIDPKRLITHHCKLDQILDAYETFADAADTRALTR